MKLKEYDRVLLKDGREGIVLSGFPDGPYFVDIGTGPETWDGVVVEPDEIEKVLDE